MNFKEIYEDIFGELPKANESGEIKTQCPFHEDSTPSFAINIETGAFNCFALDCGVGGGIIDFIAKLEGVSKSKAMKILESDYELSGDAIKKARKKKKKKKSVPPISANEISKCNTIIQKSKKVLDFLKEERGLTKDTVNKFKIGWDGDRVTIPIPDDEGLYRNVRRYKPNSSNGSKVISYGKGYGSARLFPERNLVYDEIMICEGEMDTILANQMGYKALTVTGGAGTWKKDWCELFKDKIVYICFDIDEAGKKGARKVARMLLQHAQEVKIIDLPINEPKNGDLTDYYVKHGKGKQELDKLIKDTKTFKIRKENEKPTVNEVYEVHLSEASKDRYFFKNVEMNVIVSGKDLAPYIIPKVVEATCTMDTGKVCNFCAMRMEGGEKEYTFEPTDAAILELIACSKDQQKGIIKKRMGIPKNCYACNINTKKAQNVEEIMMIPELDFITNEEREYVIRRGFYVGHGLKTNSSYKLKGITVPEPWKQYSTHLIHEAQPSQDSISNFEMTKEKKGRLEIFQPSEKQSISAKFDEIANDLTHNVTHIYCRKDLIKAIDLVYHSVLGFEFQNQRVKKGWVEILVIGDTRTGKSETAHTLMKHYKLGELVTGENTSFAGLIGGMQQTQNRWSIAWGKIPLNDRRLVVLDEVSGLNEDEIGHMSNVRSSGIAEITKIQTEKTHARTRLIWISNSRDGRPMREYGYGIWAIKKLIGKSEDIARFEFAVACASEDVAMSEINKKVNSHKEVEHRYTTELCKDLILWAWSRKPENIKFTDSSIEKILHYATEMGEQYSSKIPLIEGANQRIKLARLAVAAACRTFSTDDSGEDVIVKEGHVDFVYDFINKQYKKTTMGYWDFSEQQNESVRTANDKRGDVITYLENKPDLGDLFLQYDHIKNSDIEYIADMEKTEVKNVIKFLSKNRMLRRASRGYKKTPAFGRILKEWKEQKRKA